MLNIVNERPLTVDERKSILMRALHATPFFNFTQINVVDSFTDSQQVYKEKVHIYIDFYLTEFRANFNDVETIVSTDFNISVYLAEKGISVYGFTASQELPTPFIFTDGRISAATPKYQDRQRESFPFLINSGEDIITQIKRNAAINDPAMVNTVLCGFNHIDYPYLNDIETEKINDSLDDETLFQTFEIEVDHNTGAAAAGSETKFYNFTNDNRPRLILGFGVVDETAGTLIKSEVDILDSTRHIRLTNKAIPVELLAPRQPIVQDTHIYYLPIEHYFMPFGNIRLGIKNTVTAIAPEINKPYKLVMLTRTV